MVGESESTRLRTMGLAVWHFVSNAPLTYSWLSVLVVTTIIQNQATGRQLTALLMHRSTNIQELATHPLKVLFSSLLWIDGKSLEPYLLLFTLFLAPAEHWLGQLRWLTVGLTSHILSTYVSETALYFAIEFREASGRMIRAGDIGVSYFLVGVMTMLTYHIVRPWRWGYLGVLFIIFGFPLITMDKTELDFTAIGHFTAILVGLAFYPMAKERKDLPWSPERIKARLRRPRSPSGTS